MAKRPKRFYEGGMDEKEPGWESKEAPAVSPKSNIVTKEQLAESGLSLRDYMNKQQGLTRRGESKSDTTAIIAKGQANNDADRKETEAAEAKALEQSKTTTTTAKESAPAKRETYRDFSGNIQTKKSTEDRDAESAARREKVMDTVKSVGSGIGSMFNKAIENYKSTVPRYNKEKKMASGGKVSSASSRGDGIATKGKTRGRLC
jgi:hypothetical protein